ncbi:hypothetical protein [Paenibacillus sp. E194]|uniref:hypothetical protein n=1 Tax=Paenibacillus sp. E194 TaxID=1458845 RepID=UPI000AB882CE
MSNVSYPLSKKWIRCTLLLTLCSTLLLTSLGFTTASALAAETSSVSGKAEIVYLQDSSLSVGDSRILTRQQIESQWDGIDPDYTADKAVEAVCSALPEKEYEALFPMRLGSKEWHAFNKDKKDYNPNQTDYYSYQNLINAVSLVANVKYKVSYREGNYSAQEIYRLEKREKPKRSLYAPMTSIHQRTNQTHHHENR